MPAAALTGGGSLEENNPMIVADWEETGDATQAHRSTARVAAGDSCFPRTGGCSGEGLQRGGAAAAHTLQHCSRKDWWLEEVVAHDGTFARLELRGLMKSAAQGFCSKDSEDAVKPAFGV